MPMGVHRKKRASLSTCTCLSEDNALDETHTLSHMYVVYPGLIYGVLGSQRKYRNPALVEGSITTRRTIHVVVGSISVFGVSLGC
jgi:hypothetical protein